MLQYLLVREHFFTKFPLLSAAQIRALLDDKDSEVDFESAALTLIGARWYKANLSNDLLIWVLDKASSREAWKQFALSGYEEAKWVLENRSEWTFYIVEAALINAPKLILPVLLAKAVGDERRANYSDHPLHPVEDWIQGIYEGSNIAFQRRNDAWKIVQEWLLIGREITTGLRALGIILSPNYEAREPAAGSEGILVSFGYISTELMLHIQSLWPDMVSLLEELQITDLLPILDVVGEWAYVHNVNGKTPSQLPIMTSIAEMMMRDLIPLVKDHAGPLHRIKKYAVHLKVELNIPLEIEFEILYPLRETDDWKDDEQRQLEAVRELALQWCSMSPTDILPKLAYFEAEARSARLNYPRWSVFLCKEIARQLEDTSKWRAVAKSENLPADIVAQF